MRGVRVAMDTTRSLRRLRDRAIPLRGAAAPTQVRTSPGARARLAGTAAPEMPIRAPPLYAAGSCANEEV